LTAKARAILKGRYYVSTEDIRAVAHPVLRHRVLTNFNAEADGVHSDVLIDRLLQTAPAEEPSGMDEAMAKRVFADSEPEV
jgi:MoxR-like ATPase